VCFFSGGGLAPGVLSFGVHHYEGFPGRFLPWVGAGLIPGSRCMRLSREMVGPIGFLGVTGGLIFLFSFAILYQVACTVSVPFVFSWSGRAPLCFAHVDRPMR